MKLLPATLRWRLSLVVMLLIAAVAVTLSLLVHNEFARTQADQARGLVDERLRLALSHYAESGQATLGSAVDAGDVPATLRAAVRDRERVTYLDDGGPVPRIWAAARIGGHVLSVRASYADQVRALRDLDAVLLISSVAVVATGALLGIMAGAGLSRRLRRASLAAGRVAAGDPVRVREAIGARPRDEAAELARAVDGMADALQARLEAERRVTADIAHELRTPVTGLVTAAQILPPSRPAELVRDRADTLRTLVEGVLEVARLDTAAEQPDLTEFGLGEFVRSSVSALGVPAEVRVLADAPVRTDSRRLERVLANLLRNADRHGAPSIEVEVEHSRIRVRDHGPGFPAELLSDGPSRFRTGSSERGSGHGLGLTIAFGQARVLGATIELSNAPDGGALVTVDLPNTPS